MTQERQKSYGVISKTVLDRLLKKVLHDPEFRKSLESNTERTLLSEGIDISDASALSYLQSSLKPTDAALLADGQVKKIFAVASSASIMAAVSTPAFPKGEE
jgi:hypothetical protein